MKLFRTPHYRGVTNILNLNDKAIKIVINKTGNTSIVTKKPISASYPGNSSDT